MTFKRTRALVTAIILGGALLISTPASAATKRPFPVIGSVSYSNDYYSSRGDDIHHAIDILAKKMQKIVSRRSGVVTFVGHPQPSWGYAVFVRDEEGKTHKYIHINNDTPGTDNGKGGGYYAYGPDIFVGANVVEGQLLGYVGDSGNAESTASHLHYEVSKGGKPINPYSGLKNNSFKLSSPRTNYPNVGDELLPYTTSFKGGASVAVGDVDNDGADEIVIGPGPGQNQVRVFEQDKTQISQFVPSATADSGGVDIAVGDVDNDGADEIVTGPGQGGVYVKVFELDGTLLSKFMPNGGSFKGGANVAVGDVDGDGVGEIITGSGVGGKEVRVFEYNGTLIHQFTPFSSSFTGGVTVSSGNVQGGAEDEIIASPRRGGGPRVSVFGLDGTLISKFDAYDAAFRGGIRLETANVDSFTPYDEILTTNQSLGKPQVKTFQSDGVHLETSDLFAEEWWRGYYDIGASDSVGYATLGVDRRTSVRPVSWP